MALRTYTSADTRIWFKVITGKAHPSFRALGVADTVRDLGIAFRTHDAPVGYLPFYAPKDFNLDGRTSLLERGIGLCPIDMSAPASPHTLLIREAADDVEFLGSGEADLVDIQRSVRNDLLGHAMRAASGVFVDSVMLALGGPAIRQLTGQLVASPIKQFLISRAISGAAKRHLKHQGNVDVDKFLGTPP